MTNPLEDLLRKPDLRDLARTPMHMVMGTRLVVICQRAGHDPRDALAERLGSPLAATRLLTAVQIVGDHWPDCFLISPPCCRGLGPDEMALSAMTAAAAANDRLRFDTACREMLDAEARDATYAALSAFARTLPPRTAASACSSRDG
ncbi:addiction module antidote protein [Sphingosinicella sp.]|uniref:addiction module antidote protein n=1 Tax=Sphingosinicella sp. TaxID=1917971 RepID=UPI0035ADD375